MSVVTALSLALVVGFVATGLVGFHGWRQRMREGADFTGDRILTPSRPSTVSATRERRRSGLEGARL